MTIKQIETLLKTTGFPVAYHHFNKAPVTPYIVFIIPYTTSIKGDDKVLVKAKHLQVELYTDKKNEAAEETLENVLDSAELPYDKSEAYIESEKLYQIIYESEVI